MLKKNINIFWLLYLLIQIGVSSCQTDKKFNRIFFGGQIINPSASFVTLYKDNKTIDCLSLNKNYRFFKYYDSLEVGIYKLEHIPEYKSVFLEKGDSIWVRINASSFNESIVYSGRGSAKNNFMMDLLLYFEEENSFLSSKYSKDGVNFKSLIDSLLNQKKRRWIEMDSINHLTPIAQKITQAAYIYPYATRKERYALLRGTNWNETQNKSYFDYRKYLSFGETDLAFFDPYINYLMNYLSEKALDSAQNYFRNKQTTIHNIKRLQLINQYISGSVLKNNLARALAFEELLNLENQKNHDEFLKQFLMVNNSKSHFNEVLGLHNDINNMSKGRKLPELALQNHKLDTISSNLFYGRPTVLYFWSQTQMGHYRNTIQKAKKLSKQFPQYQFKGVCLQPFNEIVLQVHKMMEIPAETQLAFIDFEKGSKQWVVSLLNRAIVLDKKGVIIDGFGNFSSPDFSNLLRKY
mgnify:FL=1